MLIDVHDIPAAITAGGVESAEKDAIRIIRIHGNSLVVPILGVIARTAGAVEEQGAGRASNLSPGGAAVGRPVGAELATVGASAAAVWVRSDGLDLGVHDVRVAGRDRELNAAQLIAGSGIDIGRAAGRIESRPAVGVGGNRREI